MSDSGDDDLPYLSLGDVRDARPSNIRKIDVDAEIAEGLARKARIIALQQEQAEYEAEKLVVDLPTVPDLQEPTITGFPVNRPIFHADRSLTRFSSSSLIIRNLTPPTNFDEFLPWLRSEFKEANADKKLEILQFLWLLMSCHPDEFVVQNIYDVLIEYNECWRLKYDEVLVVFINWGVSISDCITDINLDEIITPLETSPIVSAFNVENVLRVLAYQLRYKSLDGSKTLMKPLFIILTLLTLDENYLNCVSDVVDCLEQIASSAKEQSAQWAGEYCEGLLSIESDHARIAFLAECILPESMRWCLCLAFCQKFFSLKVTYEVDPKPAILRNILLNHVDDLIEHESCEKYSFISIINSGISNVISCVTEDNIKRDFLVWLNEFMEKNRVHKKIVIDVDKTLIAELVSRLQVGWESSWLEEPQVSQIVISDESGGDTSDG